SKSLSWGREYGMTRLACRASTRLSRVHGPIHRRMLKKAHLLRWRPRPPCHVAREVHRTDEPSSAGPRHGPALPEREYVSRAAVGRRLAAGPFSSLWPSWSDRLLARWTTRGS